MFKGRCSHFASFCSTSIFALQISYIHWLETCRALYQLHLVKVEEVRLRGIGACKAPSVLLRRTSLFLTCSFLQWLADCLYRSTGEEVYTQQLQSCQPLRVSGRQSDSGPIHACMHQILGWGHVHAWRYQALFGEVLLMKIGLDAGTPWGDFILLDTQTALSANLMRSDPRFF